MAKSKTKSTKKVKDTDCFFYIKPKKKEVVEQDQFFTLTGDQDFFDKDKNPCAKKDSDKVLARKIGSIRQIKIGPNGHVFNPVGLYSEKDANKFNKQKGRFEYQYRRVNKEVFDNYVNFLRTKNVAWIRLTERGLI